MADAVIEANQGEAEEYAEDAEEQPVEE